jgi:hypothetical protein
MKRTVAKENTSCRAESKLSFIIGTKIRPTCTAKDSKRFIVWFGTKEFFSRSVKINDLARKEID